MKCNKYKTKSGKEIRLWQGDCHELMDGKPENYWDLSIVDPPYGIDVVDEFKKTVKSNSSMFNMSNGISGDGEWDKSIPQGKFFDRLLYRSENQIIWGGNYFIDHLYSSRCMIVWDKMNGTNPMADAELAWTSFNKSVGMFRMHHFSKGYGTKIHPTQKPIKLYRWLLTNYAEEDDTILDTHGGSMSLAIACYMEDYELDIIELDEDYYSDAVNRFEKHISQQTLF